MEQGDDKDRDDQDERHLVMVDASLLATNVASLAAGVSLRVFLDYLRRTDKLTAIEALEHAIEMTSNPFEHPKIEPEVEGMYFFKVSLELVLETSTKNVLEDE
jgi:hypothetical protein